jgi:hypothetical protein
MLTPHRSLRAPPAVPSRPSSQPRRTRRRQPHRLGNDRASLPRAATRSAAAAGIGDRDYMPSNWAARTYPYGSANRFGWHLKRTDLLFSWKARGSQSYFDGSPGTRGFEAEAYPVGSKHYSRGWASFWSWQPATPNTYRDDLFEDGANPHFALGAARGNLLAYNTIYAARWDTDSQYPSSDTGTAQLDGQATARRPTNLYCVTHLQRDSACMFATATHVLGTYALGTSLHYWAFP